MQPVLLVQQVDKVVQDFQVIQVLIQAQPELKAQQVVSDQLARQETPVNQAQLVRWAQLVELVLSDQMV